MTLSSLAYRNARRQARDYMLYFFTIILAAALLYAFNGLVFSQELLHLSDAMRSLSLVVTLTCIASVFIIGWLVDYTTNFMLSRRSRELGTYILTGLENRQAARLFFLENMGIGVVAFLLGILLGNLIFQILRAILLALFDVPYTFRFAFSLRAAGLTLFYFSLIYLTAQIRSHKRIRSMKIYDLIYYDRQNENTVIPNSSRRRKVFTGSIVLGIIGTLLLLMRHLLPGLLGAACIVAFLYGFFISFSSGVPAWFEKHPSQKYQGQTLLVFRTLSSKLAAMGIVMATISLLLTAVLISQGSGLTFSILFQNRAKTTACFDLMISTSEKNQDFKDYQDYIHDHIPVKSSMQYAIYQGDNLQVTDYILSNTRYFREYDQDLFIKFSDYAALRAMLGYPEITLGPQEYLIHCMPYLKGTLSRYSQPISVGSSTLAPGGLCTENFAQNTWDTNGRGFLLVAPDSALESRPVSHTIYAAMTEAPVSEAQYNALFSIRDGRKGYDVLEAKEQAKKEAASSTAVLVFPLYDLALVLIMTAAAILTIQQLSETGRYRRQFRLLWKLGMPLNEMKKALRLQFALYYTMPALPPLLISIPFILSLGGAVEPGTLSGASHPLIITGITLGLFLVIYLAYILMAYASLKRNVLPLSYRKFE